MTLTRPQQKLFRGSMGIIGALLLWELLARSGLFPTSFTPSLIAIAQAAIRMIGEGQIFIHIAFTLARVLIGMLLAFTVAIPIGIAMGRWPLVERFFIYPLSCLMPIPSLAWVPLFILWMGLGNVTTIAIVTYASVFPMIYNLWSGVRSINPIWMRSAVGMSARAPMIFWKVILPASLPFMITGVRLSFGRAWMAVIGAELLAATDWGLGRLVFEAREWLTIDIMLNALICIGLIGLFFEKVVFAAVDRRTVQRWGLVREVGS